jgi:diguanylate cyclase (GGDEF)-like protein
MQKEASVSPHSPAHSIAALNQDELTQERTAIVALLGNYRRLRERFVEAMEVQYRDFLVQRAISMMKANKWIAVLFYLFIGLLTYQQVRYVSTFASLEHELSLWIIIYIGGALVFSSIAVCVSNAKLDRYYSWYISIPSFIGLTGINIIASSFDSAYINQQASYVAIFIYMLMYSLGSLRLMHAFLVGGFASLLALAVIITFKLPVEFGQYAQYAGLSNLMGGLIASMIDQRDRRGFLQSRLIEIEKQQLNQLSQEMARISQEDVLTTLANRRHFNETLAREWAVAEREQQTISLIFIDVDHFKPYNDTYGHLEGDRVLNLVGKTLKTMAKRPADLAARYGGEEFVLLLPNTTTEGAYELAQEVRQAIDNLAIPHKSSKAAKHVSVSIGLSALIPNAQNSITTLIDNADEGVYAAKKAGRHRIRIYPTPDAPLSKKETEK